MFVEALVIICFLAAAGYFAYTYYATSADKEPYQVQACIFSMDDGTQAWSKVRVLLKALRDEGFGLALCTSLARAEFEKKMAAEPEVLDLVDVIVTYNEVASGKPAPDLYVEAARRLRVDPTRCLVFDETPAGIEGARLAGMLTAAVGPAVGARFGELAPEWMLRDISGFKLREITLATATAAEVEPAPPSLLSRLLPVGALAMCLGPPKRSAGYGVMPSQTIPNV